MMLSNLGCNYYRPVKYYLNHHYSHIKCKNTILNRNKNLTKYQAVINNPATFTTHTLNDGVKIEIIQQLPEDEINSKKIPLVFIHGSYHGAWCYKYNYLPYFSKCGYPCYALSVRGHGESEKDVKIEGTLDSLLNDINSFIDTLPNDPIIICHSASALYLYKHCLSNNSRPALGYIFLCAVPPVSMLNSFARMFQKDFIKTIKLAWYMARKSVFKDKEAFKFVLFSDDISDDKLDMYFNELNKCEPVQMVNLRKLSAEIPFPQPLNKMSNVLILGAENDCVIDKESLFEIGKWFGDDNVKPIILNDLAHDIMLDTRWETSAEIIKNWIDDIDA